MRLILFWQMLVTTPRAKGEVLFRVLPSIAAKEKEDRLLCPPFAHPAPSELADSVRVKVKGAFELRQAAEPISKKNEAK